MGERFLVEILGRKFHLTADSYSKAAIQAAHEFNEEMDRQGELNHKISFLVSVAKVGRVRPEDV